MSLEIVIRYALVIFLPTIYLYILATFVYAKMGQWKLSKFIIAYLLCSALGYTFDFMRVLLPTSYNHVLHILVVLTFNNLGFAFLLHLLYNLVKTITKKEVPLCPQIFYLIPVLGFGYGLIEHLFLQYPTYEKINGWMYNAEVGANALDMYLGITFFVILFILLIVGIKYAKSKTYRQFFLYMFIFNVIANAFKISWRLHILPNFLGSWLPPTPVLFVSLLIGTLLVVLVAKLDFLPHKMKKNSFFMETSPKPIIYLNEYKQIIDMNSCAIGTFHFEKGEWFETYFQLKENSWDTLFEKLHEYNSVKGFHVIYEESGQHHEVLIDASKVQIFDEAYYYLMFHDVTDEYKVRRTNEFLAFHDSLTHVYNRAYFEKEVRHILKTSNDSKQSIILLADLNNFKHINDTYGHLVGDRVLIHTSKIFRSNLPERAILARLGGDEFIMFWELTEETDDLTALVKQLYEAFAQSPYEEDNIKLFITPSIGFATTKQTGFDYEVLCHWCDQQMYIQKRTMKYNEEDLHF